ncbi:Uncharacterized protein TCM_042859 [Theobroma cacao]|uniref:RNI-like superfamily protein n=1 Tax=Theobroma cacao TaxID=3641 RepID=A0A061FNM7_THECC|nr:Uncharacterized protein TCM_042859 [Theobroma cacao]
MASMHDGSLEDVAITVLSFLMILQNSIDQETNGVSSLTLAKWPFPYNSNELLEPNRPLPNPRHRLSSYIFKIENLHLISVSCLTSKALASMVSNFLFLDSLIIAKCRGLQSLDMEDATGLRKFIVLDCPQLEHFYFGGSCLRCWISFNTLSRLCLQRLKKLRWIDYSAEKHNSNSLLCFLKLCPRLRRRYVTIDAKSYNMTSAKRIPGNEMIIELQKLELLKLEGFANENEEINFIKQLTPLFEARPVIIVKSNGTCSWQLIGVPELEKEGNCAYKFEEVKNLHEICPHPVHMKL